VLGALFVVSQRFESSAHHYDTVAAARTLPTAAPGITAPPATMPPTRAFTTPPSTTPPVTTTPKFTGRGFRAAFPGTPQPGSTSFDVGAVHFNAKLYVYNAPDAGYVVSSIEGAGDICSCALEQLLQGSAAGMHGTVTSSHPTTFQGYDAYEGVATSSEGPVRLLAVNARDSVIEVVVWTSPDSPARYNAFRDSLEVI
jgi:hypothetical protein